MDSGNWEPGEEAVTNARLLKLVSWEQSCAGSAVEGRSRCGPLECRAQSSSGPGRLPFAHARRATGGHALHIACIRGVVARLTTGRESVGNLRCWPNNGELADGWDTSNRMLAGTRIPGGGPRSSDQNTLCWALLGSRPPALSLMLLPSESSPAGQQTQCRQLRALKGGAVHLRKSNTLSKTGEIKLL